jgi:choline dehydrogenase-like flavoprotein
MSPHYLVIGSGPSGMACAAALLETQARVTMIDIGADLTPATQDRAAGLAQQSAWSGDDRAWIQRGLKADAGGIPLKTLFGEDFMYARRDVTDAVLPKHFGQWPGQSVGGLSRVWGATLKRLGPRELSGWPFAAEALAPHYAAAERLLGPHGPAMSGQARELLGRWNTQTAAMTELGITVSPASLAVSPDCRLCGMCLYGCPYGYIFSSHQLLPRFQAQEKFSYRGGLKALRLVSRADGTDAVVSQPDGSQTVLTADRVFVAAGVLGTARLMLKSFYPAGEALTLQDGQYFLLPFLAPSPKPEALHTLSQLFMELDGPAPMHVQIYGRNDLYARALAAPFGPLAPLLRPLADLAGRRIVMAQGYLPSALSGSAQLRLDAQDRLAISLRLSAATGEALRAIWPRLARAGSLAGLRALPFLARQAEIGRGYHSGGTLPMSRSPTRFESDLLGRAAGAERVHVVDASVWPDIPSGPVTLTAMANAHRIAADVVRLDGAS